MEARSGVTPLPLAQALKERRIGGAGLDVFGEIDVFNENEDYSRSLLFALDNVILTPRPLAGSPTFLSSLRP